MRRAKRVVLALVAARKTRDAAQLPQRPHAVAPARQDLVRVGLVADIPHQPVMRRVEDVVQSHRQLHRAQVGAQVPARLRNAVQQKVAQFRGQRVQVATRQTANVGRAVDGLKQGVFHKHVSTTGPPTRG